jgi:hypothetical protein
MVRTATCDALVWEATPATRSTWVVSAAAVRTATSSDKRKDGRWRYYRISVPVHVFLHIDVRIRYIHTRGRVRASIYFSYSLNVLQLSLRAIPRTRQQASRGG